MATTLFDPKSPISFSSLADPKVTTFVDPKATKPSNVLPQLYRLMQAYTERLQSKLSSWQQNWLFKNFGTYNNTKIPADFIPADSDDLIYDIEYLARQTVRLIEKASAFRETAILADVDELEIELYLFDAENAVRSARKILTGAGISTKI